MKTASCLRDFLKYTSFNILGMLGLSCYILADTFFVTLGTGANGLTALNLAIPAFNVIHGCGLMLGLGGGTLYSIFQSRENPIEANRIFSNGLVLSLLLSAVFFILGLFCTESITILLGADDAAYELCKTYLQVILLFAPAFMLNNLLTGFVRNDGAPQLTMAAMLIGSFANIALDYLFIFPCNMGIFGAAFATGLSPFISMLILSPFFLKKKNRFRFAKEQLFGRTTFRVITTGLPSLITEISSGVVILIFNLIILRLQGNIGVAAYGVVANLSLVVMAIYTGIAQGVQPLISSYHGAGVKKNIKKVLNYTLITLLLLSGLLYAGIFLAAEQITTIFNTERITLLQQIAVEGLRVYFTACLFAGFNIILSVYFTSTEQRLPAQIITILRGIVVIIPATFLLSSVFGMIGIWSAFPVTELIVSMVTAVFFLVNKKRIFG